jgi:surface protein
MSTTLKLKNSQTVIIPAKGAKLYGKPMKLTITISGLSSTVSLPLNYYKNVVIDWGDSTTYQSSPGMWMDANTTSVSKEYTDSNQHDIYIYVYDVRGQNSSKGRIPRFGYGDSYSGNDLISSAELGELRCLEYYGTFFGAINLLTITGKVESSVRNMHTMFYQCGVFNSSLAKWDVSRIRDMGYMFYQCGAFNSSLAKWDVSSVQNMYDMFFQCSNFNSDVSKWDVSNVINMHGTFYQCTKFNSDVSKWNVSKVLSMNYMFADCTTFNSSLADWDISSVGANNVNEIVNYRGMQVMLTGTSFSANNYNKLLKAWSRLPIQDNVFFDLPAIVPSEKYQKYKDYFVRLHGWVITEA